MSPLDPSRPAATGDEGRVWERVIALERSVAALQLARPLPVLAGAPDAAAPDGSLVVDAAGSRLWARVGGGWLWTGLA